MDTKEKETNQSGRNCSIYFTAENLKAVDGICKQEKRSRSALLNIWIDDKLKQINNK